MASTDNASGGTGEASPKPHRQAPPVPPHKHPHPHPAPAKDVASSGLETASSAAQTVKDAASSVAEKGKAAASSAAQTVKDAASSVGEKGKEAVAKTEEVAGKGKEAVVDRTEKTKERVGAGVGVVKAAARMAEDDLEAGVEKSKNLAFAGADRTQEAIETAGGRASGEKPRLLSTQDENKPVGPEEEPDAKAKVEAPRKIYLSHERFQRQATFSNPYADAILPQQPPLVTADPSQRKDKQTSDKPNAEARTLRLATQLQRPVVALLSRPSDANLKTLFLARLRARPSTDAPSHYPASIASKEHTWHHATVYGVEIAILEVADATQLPTATSTSTSTSSKDGLQIAACVFLIDVRAPDWAFLMKENVVAVAGGRQDWVLRRFAEWVELRANHQGGGRELPGIGVVARYETREKLRRWEEYQGGLVWWRALVRYGARVFAVQEEGWSERWCEGVIRGVLSGVEGLGLEWEEEGFPGRRKGVRGEADGTKLPFYAGGPDNAQKASTNLNTTNLPFYAGEPMSIHKSSTKSTITNPLFYAGVPDNTQKASTESTTTNPPFKANPVPTLKPSTKPRTYTGPIITIYSPSQPNSPFTTRFLSALLDQPIIPRPPKSLARSPEWHFATIAGVEAALLHLDERDMHRARYLDVAACLFLWDLTGWYGRDGSKKDSEGGFERIAKGWANGTLAALRELWGEDGDGRGWRKRVPAAVVLGYDREAQREVWEGGMRSLDEGTAGLWGGILGYGARVLPVRDDEVTKRVCGEIIYTLVGEDRFEGYREMQGAWVGDGEVEEPLTPRTRRIRGEVERRRRWQRNLVVLVLGLFLLQVLVGVLVVGVQEWRIRDVARSTREEVQRGVERLERFEREAAGREAVREEKEKEKEKVRRKRKRWGTWVRYEL